MEHTSEVGEHLTKVSIRLGEPAGYEFETLWAEPTADYHYFLGNVPFLAYGYSERDTVSVRRLKVGLLLTGLLNEVDTRPIGSSRQSLRARTISGRCGNLSLRLAARMSEQIED